MGFKFVYAYSFHRIRRKVQKDEGGEWVGLTMRRIYYADEED